jgi:hypothetical protein
VRLSGPLELADPLGAVRGPGAKVEEFGASHRREGLEAPVEITVGRERHAGNLERGRLRVAGSRLGCQLLLEILEAREVEREGVAGLGGALGDTAFEWLDADIDRQALRVRFGVRERALAAEEPLGGSHPNGAERSAVLVDADGDAGPFLSRPR